MKPLKLPRGWMPWPPQLAHERNGTSILARSGALAVPGVVERVFLRRVERVDAVLRQFLVRERHRAGNQLTGDAAFARAFAQPVLDVGDLVLPPQLLKLAHNAAVVGAVAVAVVLPFPRDDGGEMRRTVHGDAPLVAGV